MANPETSTELGTNHLLSGRTISIAALIAIALLSLAGDFYGQGQGITFLPLVASALGVVLAGYVVVPILQQLKTGQIIREDGPQAHLKKSGTPTMGGIFIVPVGLAVSVIWSGFNYNVLAAAALTFGFGFVGWLDDWQILRYKSNKGISPITKLGLLGMVGMSFCVWLGTTQPFELLTAVTLPFHIILPIGILFFPLAMFVLLGTSNATNLTDGLDGLAAGTGAIALLGLAHLMGTHTELATFCACMSGSYLGFLWHNHNKAQVFMGDTGSLALGGAIAAAALIGNVLWGLLIIGAIFIWEAISVIAQVGYYKLTKDDNGVGQRLFKMAPYHHHLELSGWKEIQVVGAFYLVQLLLVLGAIALKFL
jgi:phospho-N-acetylmuramoyl-pentapeptide-transferase